MGYRKWLLISGTLLLLVALVAVAWGAGSGQTPMPSESYVPSANLPDVLISGLSSQTSVFNASIVAIRGIGSNDYQGCAAYVNPTGQSEPVWVISPEHRIQSIITFAAMKDVKIRVCGRKYTGPPDMMDWQDMDVYLADKIIVTLKSL